ncbi:MAG: autotransporter domain-containing protein [Rickettsiales bacterium]|nr:autotransporter domain-containing protein [Rickettsiales bacterium]
MFSKKFTLSVFAISLAFNFSAQALDYSNLDFSAHVSDNTAYNNVTVENSRTLSSGAITGGYLYLSGDVSGDVNITNSSSGSITSTHSNYGIFYLPNITNSSTLNEVNIVNEGSLTTNGAFSIPIYILGKSGSGRKGFDFTLDNSGTITSSASGLHIANGSSTGSFEITNSGTIDNSANSNTAYATIAFSAGQTATINNSGSIIANASSGYKAIDVTGGNFTLNILAGSSIIGDINAAGSNNVLNIKTNLSGTNYDTLAAQLTGSSWTKNITSGVTVDLVSLSGSDSISNSGTISALSVSGSGNTLNLNSGSSTGNISNSGALTIATGSSNFTYSNAISGSGSITKTGSGRLELSGTNTYSGATTISAGELKVNGSASSSAVTIASGATISGSGTVGSLTIQSGGTLATGNSIGTLGVSGDLTLASGSTTNFEFNSSGIDKTTATGNINIAGTANFQLYGSNSGYFVTAKNILETSGGTISGTFDNVSTQSGFSTNLTYGSSAVSARVSTNLNNNMLDGVVSTQNSVSKLLSESLSEQLQNGQILEDQKTNAWISGGGFDTHLSSNSNTSAYSTNGSILAAGLTKNYGDHQLTAGVFNSQSSAKRFTYAGRDQIDSSGLALALGKNFNNNLGNFYAFTQFGAGFYRFDASRDVLFNSSAQSAKGSGNGNFQFVGLGANQKIKTNLSGEFAIFTSANLQKTNRNGWSESGLLEGNVAVSKSAANTLNTELGAYYKNATPKFLQLPKDSSYKLELSGYKSDLISKKNATVTEGSAKYSLGTTYNQKFTLGGSASFAVPLSEKSSVTAKLSRRQNGNFKESAALINYLYGF